MRRNLTAMWLANLAASAVAASKGLPLTIAVSGDIMLNGITPTPTTTKGLFSSVGPEFAKSDIAFANVEVPLTSIGRRTPFKSAADVAARRQFVLKADPAWAAPIRESGLDIVSVANNHAMDYGAAGLSQMLSALDRQGVRHVGAGANLSAAEQPVIVSARGRRVAFIAFLAFRTAGGLGACTPARADRAGVNALNNGDYERLRSLVTRAKQQADMVVVSLHWGIERERQPNAYQVELARKSIDLGADAVVGHHPHVLQPYERYKGKPIFYSLGNFVAPNYGGPLGQTLVARMRWRGNDLVSLRIIPARIAAGSPRVLQGAKRDTELQLMDQSVALFRKRFGSGG